MNKYIKFLCIFFSVLIVMHFSSVSLSQQQIDFEQIAEEVAQEERSAIVLENEYRIWALNHQKKVFGWNHYSSVIIFFFVVAMISIGLYFSYMQFKESFRNSKNVDLPPSTMKVGQSGVEISSSIVGLLILIVSLAFFYLYLENVYPIQVTPFIDISPDADAQLP